MKCEDLENIYSWPKIMNDGCYIGWYLPSNGTIAKFYSVTLTFIFKVKLFFYASAMKNSSGSSFSQQICVDLHGSAVELLLSLYSFNSLTCQVINIAMRIFPFQNCDVRHIINHYNIVMQLVRLFTFFLQPILLLTICVFIYLSFFISLSHNLLAYICTFMLGWQWLSGNMPDCP